MLGLLAFIASVAAVLPDTTALAQRLHIAVSVDLSATHQVMDGFGGAAATAPAMLIHGFAEPQRTDLVDLLFSTDVGIGLSILRSEVLSGNHDAANKGLTGAGTLQPDINTHEPSEGIWNWEGDKCQVWLMQQAQQRGVNRLMSTVWSAPAWMKSNNDYRGKTPSGELGYLIPSKQQAFADYLARYISEYATRFNVTITHVSPANEPTFPASYQGCLWSAENLTSFIRDYLGPTFKKSLLPKHPAAIVAPEIGSWSNNDFTGAIVNDSAAAAYVGVIANHGYNQPWYDAPVEPLELSRPASMSAWMTEMCYLTGSPPYPHGTGMDDALGWARNLHRHMMAGTQAWVWWWVTTTGGGGGGMIMQAYGIDYHKQYQHHFYTVPKRFWALGHYSRFVRPGFVRVNATPDNSSSVFVSAYSGEDNSGRQIVVILTNNASQEAALDISIPGLEPTTRFTQYITNASMWMEPQLTPLLYGLQATVSVVIPPHSMSTLVTIPAPLPPVASGGLVYVSDLPFISASNGVDYNEPVERDRNSGPNPYGPGGEPGLRIGCCSQPYAKGLGVSAVSRVLVHLGGKCTDFTAVIGVHSSSENTPPVTFWVAGDGVVLYTSGPFDPGPSGMATQNVSVPVANVKIMTLQVSVDEPASFSYRNDSWPVWANATVLCA
jgi:glucuronoarabinoxylan endo-1,4-beta-xylanase